MKNKRHCLILGELVSVGFDPTGKYLLTGSHSGRGVFSTRTWERIARDYEVVYAKNGILKGIGPLAEQNILVAALDSDHPVILDSPCGSYRLHCESDGIEITIQHDSV